MKWIDYREKLSIGFSDNGKKKMLANNVATFIKNGAINSDYTADDYYRFCLMTGTLYAESYPETEGLYRLFTKTNLTIPEIISYYIAFVNAQEKKNREATVRHRAALIEIFGEFLDDLNIQYEVFEDNDGYFVFPKGALELDNALVSQPLEWLMAYPRAHKTYCTALKQYSDGEYIRDVADNLRKALEDFLREFLSNEKDLNGNKKEAEAYLKKANANPQLVNMFCALLTHYYLLNNDIAKHNDKVDKTYLEFLLYQTGVFIRMLIVVGQEYKEVSHAD